MAMRSSRNSFGYAASSMTSFQTDPVASHAGVVYRLVKPHPTMNTRKVSSHHWLVRRVKTKLHGQT